MTASITVKKIDGTLISEERILSFRFRKNSYLPYTLLNAQLHAEYADFENSAEIFFYIDQKLVHHGLIDSLKVTCSGGGRIVSLVSRGFTSLLCQNQIEPGLKPSITFNQLMDGYYTLPYITHEDNSGQTGYIFVSGKTTMWDGIANLSYKFYGTYPYIRGTNCVRITPEGNPATFSYNDEELLCMGFSMNGRRIMSHYHMADMSGDYGQYEYENPEAAAYGIVRHKYSELDKEFLYEPENALVFYDKLASRSQKVFFCRYSGYNGEDLSDILSFGSIHSERIEGIEITGSAKGIFTELNVYHDKF